MRKQRRASRFSIAFVIVLALTALALPLYVEQNKLVKTESLHIVVVDNIKAKVEKVIVRAC